MKNLKESLGAAKLYAVVLSAGDSSARILTLSSRCLHVDLGAKQICRQVQETAECIWESEYLEGSSCG